MRCLYRGMREGLLLVGFLVLLSVSALAAEQTAVVPAVSTETVIICIGDSMTGAEWKSQEDSPVYAYLPAAEKQWPSLVAKALPAKLVDVGIVGERTDEMLARFQKDVLAKKPDACIIWGGANDVLQGKTTADILRNVQYMVELCQQHNIHPVLADLPVRVSADLPQAAALAALHEAYEKLAREEHVAFVDLCKTKLQGDNGVAAMYTLPDGIHLNAIGQAAAAQELLNVLRPMLQSPEERADSSVQDWKEAVQALRQAEKEKKALEVADQAIAKYPNSAELYALRANVYIDLSEIEKAEADLQKALEIHPSCVEAYDGMGVIYAGNGEMKLAKESFEKAVALAPQDASLLRDYAFYYEEGIANYPEAVAKLDRAVEMADPVLRKDIERDRLDAEAMMIAYSDAYMDRYLKDLDAWLVRYTKPASLERGTVLYRRAYANEQKGNYLQAMLDIRAARGLFAGMPELVGATYAVEAEILDLRGDETAAAKAYKQAKELDPSTYIPHYYRSRLGGALQ